MFQPDIQCQSTIRNCLRQSENSDIRAIYKETNKGNKLKYNGYATTKDVVKDIRSKKESRINNKLTTQGLVMKSIWKYTMTSSRSIWQKVVDKLPRNIYSFAIRYLSNTLANGTNQRKWGKNVNSLCLACNNPQTLGHVIGGCANHLNEGRYNYRHDSIVTNLVKTIKPADGRVIYADIEGYANPSTFTGEEYRPDILVTDQNNIRIIELTVGFETNIEVNTKNKSDRYEPLIQQLKTTGYKVEYVNLVMGAIGTYGHSCSNLKKTLLDLGVSSLETDYIMKKIVNVCIRCTYYIFCMRNKDWSNPDLMYW